MLVPKRLGARLIANPVVVVDVGARGGWQPHWSHVQDHVRFVGFEPESNEWKRLTESARPNEIYSNRVLHSAPGPITLFHTRDPSTSSVYRPSRSFVERAFPWDRMLDVVRAETLDATTLDRALRELPVVRVDFLKLDTQGSELDILKGAGTTLEQAFGVEVEVEFEPIYEGQPLFPDVCTFLRTQGFRFMGFPRLQTIAQMRFHRRGTLGRESQGEFRTWIDSMGHRYGVSRGRSQVVYGDAVFLRGAETLLAEGSTGNSANGVVTAVFVSSVLRYFEHAGDLLREAEARGLVDPDLGQDLRQLVRNMARSKRHLRDRFFHKTRRLSRLIVRGGRQ